MNFNPNEKSSNSIKKELKYYLEKGGRLTPMKALKMFGCMNFGARLSEIRQEGFPLVSVWITLDNGKRIKEHFMGNINEQQ